MMRPLIVVEGEEVVSPYELDLSPFTASPMTVQP